MGWRTTTFLEIQTRLLAEVAGLATVGLYNGQGDTMKGDENTDAPYSLPAAFIAFGGGDWYIEGDLVRYSDQYLFRIHYLDQVYQEDHNHDAKQAQAIAHLDRLDAVINALDQYTGLTYTGRLAFQREVIDENRTHIIEHVVELIGKVCDPSLAEKDEAEAEKQPAEALSIIRTGPSQHEAIIDHNQVALLPPEENPYRIT